MDNIILLYYWNKKLEDYFVLCARDIEPHIKESYSHARVIEITGKSCNQLNVDEKLSQVNQSEFLLAAYCHGLEDALNDPYGNHFIKKDVNDHLLKNAFVFTNSCDSGRILGPAAVKKGAKIFVGFIEESYAHEDYRNAFISCDNYPLKLFLKGEFSQNCKVDIEKRIKEYYDKHIDEIREKNYFAATRLLHNRNNLIISFHP